MVITELDFGGAERAFVRIAIGLKQRGWDVRVISLRDAGTLSKDLRAAGIEVTALACGGFLDFRAVRRMRNTLRQQRPEVLLTFLHQANIVGRIAGRLAKVPRIVSSVRVADRRWSIGITERLTSCCVDHYAAVSQSVADVHAKLCGLGQGRFSVIRNGVDINAIHAIPAIDRTKLGCNEKDFIILSVGRLTEQKAPIDVLSAVRGMVTDQPENRHRVKLVYIGDGPLKSKLEQCITINGMQELVRLMGHRSDVISIMKAANVLVLASRWEGLPNVILEAQATGLPVIASAVDGVQELIIDRQTGRLFLAGDVQQLAVILTEHFQLPDSVLGTIAAAREQVSRQFRWEDCIDRFEQLLLQFNIV